MLTTLRIKNLALVVDLTLDLQGGLNVITGETGAGKSILIGALSLVLGERADRTLIRGGADSCSVEAVFDVRDLKAPLHSFLDENGLEPCEESQLVLKRSFTTSGANRQFVNGSPTTLQALAAIGEWLVDIHGPHDHQSLLRPSRQLAILDAFGGLQAGVEKFTAAVRRRAELMAQKASLIIDERTYAQQLDLLRFQVREIVDARLDPLEEGKIEEEHRRSTNAARLLELTQQALGLVDGEESGLLNQAGALGRTLHELQRLDPSAAMAGLHEQAVEALRELQTELSRYADRIELDPARLQEIDERLNLIQSLKRKYGSSVADVIAFSEQARSKLQSLESRDAEVARLNAEVLQLDEQLLQAGRELSLRRQKVIPSLSSAVSKQLGALGFRQSRFDVSLANASPLPWPPGEASAIPLHGLDTVEFQFSPNAGEPQRALRAIASSGEMARVMLAIKTVLAVEDEIPVLIFDEVDANVGGETAHAVGEKMRQIGRHRQVICITHLAQVAAQAHAHYVVSKQVKEGRTISRIAVLEKDDRVTEVARMLGGQTTAARKHAEELLAR